MRRRLGRVGIWCARAYSRRIVNINLNILIAAVTAVALASGVVHIAELLGVKSPGVLAFIMVAGDWFFDLVIAVSLHWLANHWPRRWQRSRRFIDKADSVIDASPPPSVSIMRDVAAATKRLTREEVHAARGEPTPPNAPLTYPIAGSGMMNGTPVVDGPATERLTPDRHERSFVRDATMIQLQRLCLSPLFYLVAVGGHLTLMKGLGWSAAPAGVVSYVTAILLTRLLHTLWLLKTDPQVWQEWEEAFQMRQRNNMPVSPPRRVTTPEATVTRV
jgi:uncharacterized membrane protein